MRILLTGATGFIGAALLDRLGTGGHTLAVLTRDRVRSEPRLPEGVTAHPWHPLIGPPDEKVFEGVDAVIHLAGEPVTGRWTAAKRNAIRKSRSIGTYHLVMGMERSSHTPTVLVSASATGYYGDGGDDELTEDSPPGDDFLAATCVEWETEAMKAEALGARVACLRFGMVLEQSGGALGAMLPPAKLGLSGPLGGGRQWWSWVHREDVLGCIETALQGNLSGPVNVTAPEPVRQNDFARTLGRILNRPAFLPTPGFALKLVLGGFASELLASKKVVPQKATAAGYTFQYVNLDDALASILSSRPPQ